MKIKIESYFKIIKNKILAGCFHLFSFLGVFSGKFVYFAPLKIKIFLAKSLRPLIFWGTPEIGNLFSILARSFVKEISLSVKESIVVPFEIKNGGKLRLDITKKTQRLIYYQRVYEQNITNYLLNNLKVGDVFIDVGANIGYYSVLASKLVGSDGLVLAFEPEKKNYLNLKENLEYNGITNVVALNMAIGREKGVMTLHLNPLNEGGHSLNETEIFCDGGVCLTKEKISALKPGEEFTQEVNVDSLQNLLSLEKRINNRCPKVIKIDVEGFEKEVLIGYRPAVSGNVCSPKIICEISNYDESFSELLDEMGYKLFILEKNGLARANDNKTVHGDYLLQK